MIDQTNNSFDFINGLADTIKNGEDFDLRHRVESISVPTLILWGQGDEVVRFNVAEAYEQLIPDSTLKLIENAGHSPQMEKPAEIGQLIRQFVD